MKKVHSTEQLAHLFCNMINGDLEGFRTSSKNMYFENGVLYSYGPHYPMAAKHSVGIGSNHREIILINSRHSTVTTEKHKSIVSLARKPSQWRFWVPDVKNPSSPDNLIELENDIVDAIDNVLRGLKYHNYSDVNAAIERYNQYADAFKLKKFKGLDIDFDIILRRLNFDKEERLKRLEAAKEFKRKIEREAELKRYDELINRTHSNLHFWLSNSDHELTPKNSELSLLANKMGHDLIKVKNMQTIITHRGAEVPLAEGHALLNIVKAKGPVFVINKKVGEFTINKTENKPDGDIILSIGCHKISVNQSIQAFQAFQAHIDQQRTK